MMSLVKSLKNLDELVGVKLSFAPNIIFKPILYFSSARKIITDRNPFEPYTVKSPFKFNTSTCMSWTCTKLCILICGTNRAARYKLLNCNLRRCRLLWTLFFQIHQLIEPNCNYNKVLAKFCV